MGLCLLSCTLTHKVNICYIIILFQVLAAFGLIAGAVCFSGAELIRPEFLETLYHINLRAINGWLLFMSLIMIFFKVAVIMELFSNIRFLKIKIPIGGYLWHLITLIVRTTIYVKFNIYNIATCVISLFLVLWTLWGQFKFK